MTTHRAAATPRALASDGITEPRRNTAQWSHNSLREEGLIRDDIMLAHLQHTPRSVWEINGEGWQWRSSGSERING